MKDYTLSVLLTSYILSFSHIIKKRESLVVVGIILIK